MIIFGLSLYVHCLVAFSAPSIPVIDVQKQLQNNQVSLGGQWALSWGEWPLLEDIGKSEVDFKIVQLPNFINVLVEQQSFEQVRYGTYILKLKNVDSTFKQPAIRMRNVRDAWQAWWIDENGQSQHLGESGKISKSLAEQQMRFQTHILQLPKDVDAGTLVIYFSTHLYERSGMYGEFSIQEFESANKLLLADLASRSALIAIGLLVVFQNMLFFVFRPKERILLLLAVFAFSTLLRGLVTADYAYYFFGNPASFDMLTRIKYITVVWPAVAAVHFFSYLHPSKLSSPFIKIGYLLLALVVVYTAFVPLQQVISSLHFYQVILAVYSLFALWLACCSIFNKVYRSRLMIISCLALFAGVTNDIVASLYSPYNLYIAEYTLFLFLFAQTQYHSLRFVSALDVAEHLTNNLQQEVSDKTKQLSIRNQELEDKANYLKVQHDRIKELSETDHLTGLYNRQTLDGYLDLKYEQAAILDENLSLMILDIDNFKQINDSYGHLVGDDCLRAVAKYLGQTNLRADDLIARYGGEEIVIVLANTDLKKAAEVSQRICDGLSTIRINSDQENIVLTASFGVAELKVNQAISAEHLLKLADDALYQAKAKGKNQVVVAHADFYK
jgi:diguanylate cyclase (GGDEF)-like protein